MRSSPIVDVLLPKTKQRLLAALLLQPDRSWYLSELARHLQVPPSSLQRELGQFVEAGIVVRDIDGNRVYFRADRGCPVFVELSNLLAKTVGLAEVIQQALEPFRAQIEVAFVYGSLADGSERSSSDVDLMLIGAINLFDLAVTLRVLEEQLGRSVNPVIYTVNEFAKRIRTKNHFLTAVLRNELIFVVGSQNDLARLAKRAKGSNP